MMSLQKKYHAALVVLALASAAEATLLSDDFSGVAGTSLLGNALDVGGVWNNVQTDGGGTMGGKFIYASGGGIVAANNTAANIYTTFNANSYLTNLTDGFAASITFAANGYADLGVVLGLAETVNKGHWVNLVTNDVVRFTYHVGGTSAGTFDWAIYDESVSLDSSTSVRAGTETINSNDVIRLSITCYPACALIEGVATNVTQGYLLSRSRLTFNTPGLTNMLCAGMEFISMVVSNAAAPAVIKSFSVTSENIAVSRPLVLASNLPPVMTGFAFQDFGSTSATNFSYVLSEHAPIDIMHGVRDSVYDTVRATYPEKIMIKQLAWGGTAGIDLASIYPGHCLLKLGTKLTNNIAATTNDTVLYMQDYTRIVTSQSGIDSTTNNPASGYALMYALDGAGKPDWARAEHVRLLSINTNTGGITVQRAQLGTSPQVLTNGQAAIARHMMFWDNQWELNFSLECPRGGPFNLTAAEWFALQMRQNMFLNDADGFEFDVGRWQWGFPSNSKMDCDNDLVADYGYINGICSFGLGGQVFQNRLRELLGPNKIIQTDGNDPLFGQRGLKYMNGVQLESFPTGGYDIYSERFLHLRMWVSNVVTQPAFSYPFTKTPTTLFGHVIGDDGSNLDWRFRVGFAAALLTGMPHPFASVTDINFDPANPDYNDPNMQEDKGYYKWDEYVGGTNDLNNWKWLGPPLAPAVQVTNNMGGSNLLAATVWTWVVETNFTAICGSSNGTYSAVISQIPSNTLPWDNTFYSGTQVPKSLWFGTRLVATSGMPTFVTNREYTIEFEACGNDSWTNDATVFDKVPRALTINGIANNGKNNPTSVALSPEWRNYRISIIADSAAPQPIIFGVSEQIGSASIRNIRLYEGGAERWVREFTNGLVLLNMTKQPWSFTMPTAYRRFLGEQHPEINNGQRVPPTITVPSWDALFLVKTAGTNIIVPAGTTFDVSTNGGFLIGSSDTLSGGGVVAGDVVVAAGGGIFPGTNSTIPETLSFSNNLTLNGQTLTFDLKNSPAAGNDRIAVTGNLTNNGNTTIALNYISGFLNAGTYTLMTYASRQGGTFVLVTNYPNVTLNIGATNLTVTVGTGGSLGSPFVWRGDGAANAWDTTTSNWLFNSQPAMFVDGAAALFDDTAINFTANLSATLSPGSLIVNATNDYTFAGSGRINGVTSLTKNGSGQLTLNATNAYGGGTTVSGGNLRLNTKSSIGTGSLTVSNNALADMVLSGGNLTNNIVNLGTLLVENNGQLSGTISGNGNIYHTGGGGFALTLSGSNSAFAGVITNQGTLKIATRYSLGHSKIYLGDGAVSGSLELINSVNNVSGTNAVTNALILLNDAKLGNNQGPLELAGVISGGFGITKVGSAAVIFSGTNTYAGSTIVGGGTLRLKSVAGVVSLISNSPAITVSNAATFDVSQVTGGFSVLSGQSLTGNGIVTGNVAVAVGGNLSPGIGDIGTLTINGTLSLASGASFEISKTGGVLTNDQVIGLTNLLCGGALTVTHTGDTLQAGDSFQLFSAAGYSGSFATLDLPALDGGLYWNTSGLSVTGGIVVAAGVLANDQTVTTFEDTPTNLLLTAVANDSTNLTYSIVSAPTNGSLTGLNTNTGAVTYTPAANYNGADNFVFRVFDGNLASTGLVSLIVLPVNDAPLATNQSVTTPEDTATNLVLTASDIDNTSLTYFIANNPAHGSLTGLNTNTGAATYTPTTNYTGADSFTFRAFDGSLYSTGTVSLTVTPVNDAPIATNQSVLVAKDTARNLILLAGDVDGDALTFAVLIGPTNGSLSGLNPNTGAVTYTPTAGYTGVDSFTFTAFDGSLHATGTVNLTVVSSYVWQGDGSANAWDINTTANWLGTNGATPVKYVDGVAVTFDNTATNLVVNLNVNVAPGGVMVNSASNYVIQGGGITGAASLTKSGIGSLTLTNANSFTGGVTLTGGTLNLGHPNALGRGDVVVNGSSLTTVANLNGGSGVTNRIILKQNTTVSCATNFTAVWAAPITNDGTPRTLTFTSTCKGSVFATNVFNAVNSWGNTVFTLGSGAPNLRIILGVDNALPITGSVTNASVNNGQITVDLQGHNQTVAGLAGSGGPVSWTSATGTPTLTINAPAGTDFIYSGQNRRIEAVAIKVRKTGLGIQRIAGVSGASGGMNYTSGTEILGGTFVAGTNGIGAGPVAITNAILQVADGTALTIKSNLSGSADAVIDLNGGRLTNNFDGLTSEFAGIITNAGSLTKGGTGTLILSGANSYSGETTISNGTLVVNGTLGGGAVNVWSNAVLGGTGVITGSVSVLAGATFQPGLGGMDTTPLTINSNLTLAGTTTIALNRTNASTASSVSGVAALTRGGTLMVTNVGPAPVAGDSFPLFSASSSGGNFSATNLPALDAGLNWWSSNNYAALVVNAPPVANNFLMGAISGVTNRFRLIGGAFAPASEAGETLTVAAVGAAAQGPVTTDGTNLIYLATNGYTGADSFSYTVGDGRGATSAVAVVTVNVILGGTN